MLAASPDPLAATAIPAAAGACELEALGASLREPRGVRILPFVRRQTSPPITATAIAAMSAASPAVMAANSAVPGRRIPDLAGRDIHQRCAAGRNPEAPD